MKLNEFSEYKNHEKELQPVNLEEGFGDWLANKAKRYGTSIGGLVSSKQKGAHATRVLADQLLNRWKEKQGEGMENTPAQFRQWLENAGADKSVINKAIKAAGLQPNITMSNNEARKLTQSVIRTYSAEEEEEGLGLPKSRAQRKQDEKEKEKQSATDKAKQKQQQDPGKAAEKGEEMAKKAGVDPTPENPDEYRDYIIATRGEKFWKLLKQLR